MHRMVRACGGQGGHQSAAATLATQRAGRQRTACMWGLWLGCGWAAMKLVPGQLGRNSWYRRSEGALLLILEQASTAVGGENLFEHGEVLGEVSDAIVLPLLLVVGRFVGSTKG